MRARRRTRRKPPFPPETRLTELTAERDDLAHVERALGDWQRAQEDLEQADNALIAARAREAGIVARISTLAEAIDLISQGMPALVARQSEARRACALSEAAADEAAQILRAGLEEGQPCPVCGATEHRLSALDALLGEQHIANRRHAEALDAEVTQKQREQVAAQTEQAGLSRQADALAGELAELTQAQTNAKARHVALTADLVACARAANLPDAAATLAPALAARRQAGDAELAALSQARMVATSARQAEQAAREQRDTARDNHTAARDSLQAVTRAIEEVDRDLADLARDRERLSVTLAQALMPLGDIQHLPDPLAALRKAAADWRSHAQGRDETAMSLPALRTALASAGEALASARARANDADTALSQARADHSALLAKRSALLDGETVAAVSERLAAALASAARALDTTRAAREAAALARSAAEAHAAAALTRRDEAVTDHTARDADLAARLAAAGLDAGDVARVAAAGSAAIDAEAAALDALVAALGERRAVLTRCRDDLAAHAAAERPDLLGEELAEALAAATAEHTEAASNRTEAEFVLRRDDEVRERTARLRADLSRETAAAEVWLKLADLIGDATGNRFRRFAQGLTLDRLLEHGNARLADLKPRYTLERGRGGDMMIQVIDNDMAGQIRGLHNLSGGERFLVSLALALGLAEMSTAGGVRIESLFIDEGFGALDPASLGQAVALLEHLHASGRRVGVISHVEELKERIPVKIEVTPTGRGTSEIAVTAG
ncbi:hypothetical protein KRR38_31570 [Novosphingobium sp. G106]|uniref:SbcC/MukB-like Walker B domain-containing protein n=1 Tax=Novosphingobium sp. G106 TaxID=2849500 RepID=UPI001C2DEA30|nr:SbcC/MukB-like Walker B domain-containing protein [Novosphingobium sp. G106]MBV1692089.1 hypothetical protein [Novosphingobium sp. G106]